MFVCLEKYKDKEKDMKKIKWGVLGCGNIVEYRFLPAMSKEVNNGELYAIASHSKSERLTKAISLYHPPVIYDHYEELLADSNIDAVYIPLPNSLHKEWAVKSAHSGKHILCEKPITLTESDLDEMEQAAQKNNVFLMEAFACMHSPLYQRIRSLIADGEIGNMKIVTANFCDMVDNAEHLLLPEMGGGSIYDVGCYCVLSIRQITSREPVSVKATATFLPSGADATVVASFDMGDGVIAEYESSISTARKRDITVLGDKGFIRFMHTPNSWGELHITLKNHKHTKDIVLNARNTYAMEIEQFGRCILDGELPSLSVDESRKNLRMIEMLFHAIK
jgi:predicted dehydrogenase